MEKKLTALGPSNRKSYNITLPIDWVRERGMDKTKRADLSIVGDTIVVRPFKKEPKRKVIDVRELKIAHDRAISMLYKQGVDEIRVVHASPKAINNLAEFIEKRCIGFEMFDQTKDSCLIKDVAQPAEDFHVLLRRMFLINSQLGREKDPKSMNKLAAFCHRLLVKQGHHEYDKVLKYAQLCAELEHLGDEIMRSKKEKSKIGNACMDMFDDAYKLYYKFTPVQYDKVQEKMRDLTAKHHHATSMLKRINSILGMVYALRA